MTPTTRPPPKRTRESPSTRIVAIGSPHGDDQAGWLCAEVLGPRVGPDVAVRTVVKPIDVFDGLDECRQLWIIDACVTGARPGARHRWTWPPAATTHMGLSSTHGFGVECVLHLAQTLQKLPGDVTIFGVEIDPTRTRGRPSPAVLSAVAALATDILDRLQGQSERRTGSFLPVAHRRDSDDQQRIS